MTKEKSGGKVLRGKQGGLQCVCIYIQMVKWRE